MHVIFVQNIPKMKRLSSVSYENEPSRDDNSKMI